VSALTVFRARLHCLAAAFLLLQPAAAAAQQPAAPPAARAADVESIDAIIGALYDVISGPVGQPRDFDRMRSLFIAGGRLIPTGQNQAGRGAHRVMSVDDYIAANGPFLVDMGFRETELTRITEQFGNIAHTFSSYQAFRGDETQPFMRGINSIQLWHDGTRWWIVSVFWQQESPSHPLPERYLGGGA
jgi:hypothetical protein